MTVTISTRKCMNLVQIHAGSFVWAEGWWLLTWMYKNCTCNVSEEMDKQSKWLCIMSTLHNLCLPRFKHCCPLSLELTPFWHSRLYVITYILSFT